MKKSGCKRMAGFSFIKSVILVLPLLCLFCNADIQLIKNGLVKVLDGLQTLSESVIQGQKAEQDRIETMSTLLDEAKYLTNTEQLEIFLDDLQDAADEAYETKMFAKFSIAILTEVFEEKMKAFYLELQQMKMPQDPLDFQAFLDIKSLRKAIMTYADLKDKLLSGRAKDTEKNLNYVLNVLRSQELDDEL